MARFPLLLVVLLGSAVLTSAQEDDDEALAAPNEFLIEFNSTDDDVVEQLEACGFVIMNSFPFDQGEGEDFQPTMIVHANSTDFDQNCVEGIEGMVQMEANHFVNTTRRVVEVSTGGAWGLDRIDQKDGLASSDPFDRAATYQRGLYRGAGVVAYVVDTGIDTEHPEFEGRASWGYTIDGRREDRFGHGTHVAGILGSRRYGVAKEVSLVAVKVFPSFRFAKSSDIISGLWWVYIDHWNRWSRQRSRPKSVVNMSLGGSPNRCLDSATRFLYHFADISVVVSAGNFNRDACFQSPARVSKAITVGASDVNDRTAFFTNWGPCVDIFAPGVSVRSTWPGRRSAVLSGTSMASPHVAGAVALLLSSEETAPRPFDVTQWLLCMASSNKLHYSSFFHSRSPNELLFVDSRVYTKRCWRSSRG